jgi:hypothetical protein
MNLNNELDNLVKIYSLDDKNVQTVDLNDRCIVSMILMHSHLTRDEKGIMMFHKEPQDTYLSVAFQKTDENECPKGYSMMYQGDVHNEEEFYEFMIEARDNAKRYVETGKVNVELNLITHQ